MTKTPRKQRPAKKASSSEQRTLRPSRATAAAPVASLADPPRGYAAWLKDVKARIRIAQLRASVAVNRELVSLYWQIGRDILERQEREGWGTKVVDRIACDLRVAFPGIKGFSARNLKYMRTFAEAWPDAEFVQQLAAQLPWFHLCTLLDKLSTPGERNWYLAKAIEHAWSVQDQEQDHCRVRPARRDQADGCSRVSTRRCVATHARGRPAERRADRARAADR